MASLHGYEIESDRALLRLSEASGELGSIRVRRAGSSPLDSSGELVQLIPDRDCAPRFGLARTGAALVAWHADAGSFAIDADSMEIAYRLDDAAAAEGALRWEDRLGSTAVPLLAAERGGLALHASGNVVEGRCLVICAVTGRGKSTLAAGLAMLGHSLLAEDGVVVQEQDGQPVVWPGMTGALVTDAAAGVLGGNAMGPDGGPDQRGRRLRPGLPAADAPAPLGAIAILMERGGETVEIERVAAAKAHRELLTQVLSAARAGAVAFSVSARLAERVPVALVTVPDRIDSIGDAAKRVASLAASE